MEVISAELNNALQMNITEKSDGLRRGSGVQKGDASAVTNITAATISFDSTCKKQCVR